MDSGEFTLGNPRERSTSEVIEQDIVSVEQADLKPEQAKVPATRSPVLSIVPDPIAAPATDDAIQAAPVDDKPIAKPVVNRKRDKEAPVEQIEIPLPRICNVPIINCHLFIFSTMTTATRWKLTQNFAAPSRAIGRSTPNV